MKKLITTSLGIPLTCDSNAKFRSIDGKCNNLENHYWGAMSTAFLREIDVDEYDPKANSVFLDEDEKLNGVATGTYSRSLEETSSKKERKGGKGTKNSKGSKGPKGSKGTKGSKGSKGGKGGHHHGGHGGNGNGGNGNGGNGNGGNGGGSSSSCPTRSPTLPSPRYVSHTFHTSEDISASTVTHMLTQWGQFLDHDITLTPENEAHDCCTNDSTDPECFPIFISGSDSFYSLNSINCLEFSRSVAYCEENGGARQQLNGITSFIDASNVYGSDDDTAAALRSNVDGKMKVGENDLLPQVDGVEIAGDVRALEMPGLASMHTMFVREHNRLCDVIKSAEPNWNDETIYQNARRILIAEYQSIVFGGYLPALFGNNMGSLELKKSGSKYKSNTNPGMTNEFATASYRFGHSMIQGLIKLYYTDNSGYLDEYFLSENYFNTDTYRTYMENILMGLITQPAQKMDKEITSETTNLLFPEPGSGFGTDLAARNIQRGRDHGLPGFCCYYKLYDDPNHDCNQGWNKRYHSISQQNWDLLQTIYDHPNDIDLFTGALAQDAFNGGLSGKVFLEMKSE